MRWFYPTGVLLAGLIVMAGCSSTPSSPEQASDKSKVEEADEQRGEANEAKASPEPSCEEALEGRRQVWADLSRAPEQIIYYIGGERCEPER